MQENFTPYYFNEEAYLREMEKRQVRRTARNIGLMYILLTAIPFGFSFLYYQITATLGISTYDAALIMADPAVTLLIQIVLSTLMFVLPSLMLAALEQKKLSRIIDFGKPQKGLVAPFILIGVGVCAFANIATNTLASFFSSMGFSYSSPEIEAPDGILGKVLLILAISVTPALVEEFAMRGAVMGSLRRYGEDVAVLVSAVIFGLMHGNFVQIPFAFIVGLILGLAVIKTGSIWTGVIIHFINNFLSVLIDDILPIGESVYMQNAVYAGYFAICLTCAFIGIYLLKGREKESFKLEDQATRGDFKVKLGWFFSSPLIIISIVITLIECLAFM